MAPPTLENPAGVKPVLSASMAGMRGTGWKCTAGPGTHLVGSVEPEASPELPAALPEVRGLKVFFSPAFNQFWVSFLVVG